MKEGQASRTAEYMALFRALETARPRGRRLFEDRFATAFLRPRLRAVAVLARLPLLGDAIRSYIDRRWPGVLSSGVARTAFIDDACAAALKDGLAQVVILGAGFDARAYRMPALAAAAVFEVDHPSTSAAKARVVERRLGGWPAHVRRVAVDLLRAPLAEALAGAGFDARRPALFLWEGVTNYLQPEAVDATLRFCGAAAAGSRLVFTYVHRAVLETPEAFAGTDALFATLREAGETWHFGLHPEEAADYLRQRGLALTDDVPASEYRARYHGAAAAGMRGYEFYRIATARVPPRVTA